MLKIFIHYSKCKQCGKCCRAIRIQCELPKEVKQYWQEITPEEAFKIVSTLNFFHGDGIKYYKCSKLIDNKCSIHENKPQICIDYPAKDGNSFKDVKCGYIDMDNKLDYNLVFMEKLIYHTWMA